MVFAWFWSKSIVLPRPKNVFIVRISTFSKCFLAFIRARSYRDFDFSKFLEFLGSSRIVFWTCSIVHRYDKYTLLIYRQSLALENNFLVHIVVEIYKNIDFQGPCPLRCGEGTDHQFFFFSERRYCLLAHWIRIIKVHILTLDKQFRIEPMIYKNVHFQRIQRDVSESGCLLTIFFSKKLNADRKKNVLLKRIDWSIEKLFFMYIILEIYQNIDFPRIHEDLSNSRFQIFQGSPPFPRSPLF